MPSPAWNIGNILLDCLQEQFLVPNPDLPTPANFCLIAGEQISEDIDPIIGTDLCCEGLGWVRIADAVPSSNFPNQDQITTKCLPLGWAQTYEIGLLGCYAGAGDPEMMTCEEKTAEALRDSERLWTLQKVGCCFNDRIQANPKTRGRNWAINGIAVTGPRGGCIGRVMTLTYQHGKCC